MASVSGLRPMLWQHAPICCCTSGRVGAMKTTMPVGNHCRKLCITTEAINVLPVVPRYAARTARPRLVRVRTVRGPPAQAALSRYVHPCSPYAPGGGSGAYVSAQRPAHPRRQRDESVLEEGGVAHALLVSAVAVLRRARELPRRRRDAGLWRRAAACHRRLGRLTLLVRPSILQAAKHRESKWPAQRVEVAGSRVEGGSASRESARVMNRCLASLNRSSAFLSSCGALGPLWPFQGCNKPAVH